jgi:hypothetical protein
MSSKSVTRPARLQLMTWWDPPQGHTRQQRIESVSRVFVVVSTLTSVGAASRFVNDANMATLASVQN